MSIRAEALVRFSGGAAGPDALAAAKAAAPKSKIRFEPLPGHVRIEAEAGDRMAALTGAAMAALGLIGALKDPEASIDGIRVMAAATPAQGAFRSRGSLNKGDKAKPEVLMGEVTGPKPRPDQSREAFRNFMTSHRLRPTLWAKDAGVSSGEILGFLTGRSRGFSDGVAEKLARVAKVRVEDMFKE